MAWCRNAVADAIASLVHHPKQQRIVELSSSDGFLLGSRSRFFSRCGRAALLLPRCQTRRLLHSLAQHQQQLRAPTTDARERLSTTPCSLLNTSAVASSTCHRLLREQWAKVQTADGTISLFGTTTATKLKAATTAATQNPKKAQRKAAVFVLLVPTTHDSIEFSSNASALASEPISLPNVSLVFTRRSSNLSAHAAEISFPGGHWEEQDDTLADTAIREAVEELYAPRQNNKSVLVDKSESERNHRHFTTDLHVLGSASPLPSMNDVMVTPVVALRGWNQDTKPTIEHDEAEAFQWKGNPGEVDEVFTVSLSELLDTETTHELPPPRSPNRQRPSGLTRGPIFKTRHGDIWGLTAFILRPILHQLFKPVFGKAATTAGDNV